MGNGGITFTDDIENDGKAKVKFDFELGEKAEGICVAILDSKVEGHREPGTWGKGLGYDGRAGAVLAVAFQNGGFGSKRGICCKLGDKELACMDKAGDVDICFEGKCEATIKLEKEEDSKDDNKEKLTLKIEFENDKAGVKQKLNFKLNITGATGEHADKVLVKDLQMKGDF